MNPDNFFSTFVHLLNGIILKQWKELLYSRNLASHVELVSECINYEHNPPYCITVWALV